MLSIQPLSRHLWQRPIYSSLFRLNKSIAQWPRLASTANEEEQKAPESPSSSFTAPFMRPPERSSKGRGFQMVTYKPRTPSVRHLKRVYTPWVWKGRPYLPLTFPKKGHAKGGRNSAGRITVRHRGGGHKRRIRTVDFMRMAPGPHSVDRIERDPNRSGHIALITNQKTGKKSYILAADGVREGDVVQSYRAGIPEDLLASMGGIIDPGVLAAKTAWRGNCLPLHMIPVGTVVHAVGSSSVGAAVFCRSAGTCATVISKAIKYVILRLQSGEVRKVSKDAPATVGIVSNPTWHHRQHGKAGRKRWLGIRPTVRGVAMNSGVYNFFFCFPLMAAPLVQVAMRTRLSYTIIRTDIKMFSKTVDHPHGGGRGKSKGNRHPVSPWGIPAKSGYKTSTDSPSFSFGGGGSCLE